MNDRETNDRFRKEDRRDMVPAAVLSGCVHVILFVGLFSVFQWTTDSETVYAELWAPSRSRAATTPRASPSSRPKRLNPSPTRSTSNASLRRLRKPPNARLPLSRPACRRRRRSVRHSVRRRLPPPSVNVSRPRRPPRRRVRLKRPAARRKLASQPSVPRPNVSRRPSGRH